MLTLYTLDPEELLTLSNLMVFSRNPLIQRTIWPFLGLAKWPSVFK